MFHGNKKKEQKPLTQDERKKLEEQLIKIKAIQANILEKKKNEELNVKNLEFLLKAGAVMPDHYTLWNYRKMIIEKLMTEFSVDDFYNFVLKEIKQISPLMLNNPKSYVLWHHRLWSLDKACQIEKKKATSFECSVLGNELQLCNKFLEKDDRNFHCWNFRLAIFGLIRKFFEKKFWDFLEEELEFTHKLVAKNFSNYSAWHYRSKLIPLYFARKNIDWNTQAAIDFFATDLKFLTNAMYTDPKDQSPWNYHLWVLNNLTPIYLESIRVDKGEVVVKFSDVVKLQSLVEIVDESSGKPMSFRSGNRLDYSDSLRVDLQEKNNFLLKKKSLSIEEKVEQLDINLNLQKDCFSRHNLELPEISFSVENSEVCCQILKNNFTEDHISFLKEQFAKVKKLIDSSELGFLEYAHFRLMQIAIVLYFNSPEEKTKQKENVKTQCKILIENSRRMKRMYQESIPTFN